MILEHALLPVLPGREEDFEAAFAEAKALIASMEGFRGLTLSRCLERQNTYLLLVEWETLEDHTEGFRGSQAYLQWRDLLHGFYEPMPVVEHFTEVHRTSLASLVGVGRRVLLPRAATEDTMVAEGELQDPEPDLNDGVVWLRRWQASDQACVQAASDEGHIPQSTTVPAPFSVEAGQEWIARQHGRTRDGQGWSLAIAEAESGRAVGCVVLLLRPQSGVVGLGYWLAPDDRGRGYATRAVGLLTSWALQAQAFARVEAWVEPDNAASVAVLRRCGFDHEGRLRSFLTIGSRRVDAAVYAKVADRGRPS